MAQLKTYKPAIIIPVYRREKSLKRLLKSINEASFPAEDIQLIISVDGNPAPQVIATAKNFSFNGGTVEVIEHQQKQGLYNHLLECADYSEKFGSVLILEDDLVVSPAFYKYACRALSFYDEDESISGVALYSQRFNETSLLPFEPLESEWAVYFMQLGCSWGQAWTHKQWKDFKQWHAKNNPNFSLAKPEIPRNIQKWGKASWKKHYNHYLIDQDKYIVYPYSSFSTNCADAIGTNVKFVSNIFHVPLNIRKSLGSGFKFPKFAGDSIRYDCFMEPKGKIIEQWTDISLDDTAMDLYGTKPVELLRRKKYTVTSKDGKNPLRSFPLSFRPIELNLKHEINEPEDAFLHLFKTEDVEADDSLSKSQYYQLAHYSLYIFIHSRRFAVFYFKEFINTIWKRTKRILLKKILKKTEKLKSSKKYSLQSFFRDDKN